MDEKETTSLLRDILRQQEKQTAALERLGDGMHRLADVLKKELPLLMGLNNWQEIKKGARERKAANSRELALKLSPGWQPRRRGKRAPQNDGGSGVPS